MSWPAQIEAIRADILGACLHSGDDSPDLLQALAYLELARVILVRARVGGEPEKQPVPSFVRDMAELERRPGLTPPVACAPPPPCPPKLRQNKQEQEQGDATVNRMAPGFARMLQQHQARLAEAKKKGAA